MLTNQQEMMYMNTKPKNFINVKDLCIIAAMAAIETVVFTSFSFILYLECITFTIVLFAMCFTRKQAVLASLVFTIINLSIQGVTPWSMMYCLIYPTYSFLIASLRPLLNKHFLLLVFLCAFFSFLTGQLVQLPFMFISKKITLLYIFAGLQVSVPQGIVSGIFCFICFKPVYNIIRKIS